MRKNFIRSAVTAVLVTLAAALVFAAAVCLTSCGGSDVDTPPAADGNAYLVIESGADDMYSVYSLDASGLGNVFDMLDAADVKYATTGSGDMRMIVSVGGLTPSAASTYAFTRAWKRISTFRSTRRRSTGAARRSSAAGSARRR